MHTEITYNEHTLQAEEDHSVNRAKKLILCILFIMGLAVAQAMAETGPSGSDALRMEERISGLMEDMTLEEKVYQLFIVTPETVAGVERATKATGATQKGLTKYPVGGIIYFSANIVNESQITQMIANSQAFAKEKRGIGLFIAVDEEGGSIARVAGKLQTAKIDSMKKVGQRGDPKEAYEIGAAIAGDISPLGFNLDFAPVADVIIDGRNTEIGSRSFGSDPVLVSAMVEQVVKGLQENGVMATLKHFPGHGSTTDDSHKGTAATSRTISEMEQAEFLPFQAGIGAGAEFVMISHLTALEIDRDHPASLSKSIVTGLLREKLQFDGLVITDALKMRAVSGIYSSGEASVLALQAGVDVLLMPVNLVKAVQGILAAVESGRLSNERIEESVRRILCVKWKYGLLSP